MKNLLLLICFVLAGLTAFGQGSTTSSVRGVVTDSNSGETLIGASIIAVHLPSGTQYGTVSDIDGSYRIPGMRIGGPYKITVTYTGFAESIQEDVYLRLGERQNFDFDMTESAVVLSGIEVTASALNSGQNSGVSTQITEDDINLMPTLNRDLNDFTRLTPQAKGTFGGGFSIAGMNNRYNAIYIDGAVNNDVFGLADNGTNGGQTGIAPISIDAIDQIQVVVSPYDVTLGGFAGGGISAVTKSGTNNFEGTAYYFIQNESLAGKDNKTFADRIGLDERERLDEFSNELYGFSLGGPIVKDKVFFFVNAELQNDETPVPFDFEQYRGNSTEAELQNLSNVLTNEYGYNPGGFLGKTDKLEGTRLFGKIDINLNESHRLTVRHQYTKAEQTNVFGSSSSTINFANNGVFFPSTTNSSAIELNSMFGTKASNNLIVGYTAVRDDRDPLGGDFPYLIIEDGEDGTIRIGSEQFSTANALDQDIFTITNNFKLYKGAHTLTFGTHNEFNSFYNLFIRQNYGVYEFDSVADFLNGNPATAYNRSYSLVDDISGDGSAAAAEFNTAQLGFYAQDEWAVNRQLTLTYGLRLDIPLFNDDPAINNGFNDSTAAKIEQFYDLQGARSGQAPGAQLMWSPRVGFNYDLLGDGSTILRGGLGIFTSRVPFVWPGGMFTNNGLTVGSVDEGDISDDDLVDFIADPFKQYENENFTVPSGQVDLFAEDFKYPQVFRTSLALDKGFGNGWNASIEGMFTKTLNNVRYQSVNSNPTVDFNWTNGGDDRPIYVNDDIDPTYFAVYLADNTSEGYTYNITGSVAKNFPFGLGFNAAYTYGDAEAIFEGTSSQNSSQWRGAFNVDGRNNAPLGRSDFSLGHRLIMGLNYKIDWNQNKNAATTISLFLEGQSGEPYSYVYGRGAERADRFQGERGSNSRNRSLVWIPENQSDITLIDNGDMTAAEQWAALDQFIEDDDYLSENRGSYAEKNASRTPWETQIDFRLLQDFSVKAGGKNHTLQFSVDVFNFTNLLNSEWGVVYNNPFAFELLNFEGYDADGTTPLFTFTEDRLGDDRFDINNFGSRWRMRLGLRYIFN
ncbi:MAG: TonB-dependent receptor [Bacteroidota bacterium]